MTEPLIDRAMKLLGQECEPVVRTVLGCDGGPWYIKEKIIGAPDNKSLLDNTRPMKYAYNFVANGAQLEFVHEAATPSPDLHVCVEDWTFFVEVRNLNLNLDGGPLYPSGKLISAVTEKKRQIPYSEIGFVAVDNFDLNVESRKHYGFTYEHIEEGLCELEHLAMSNPNGWFVPSGVIVAASTASGSTLPIEFPHFVWTNANADPASPAALTRWISSALPGGRPFCCSGRNSVTEPNEITD